MRPLPLLLVLATGCFGQASYQGIHSYVQVTKSPIQTISGAFSVITDTDFVGAGVPVMLLTTGNTCVGTDHGAQNKSWVGFSGSEDYAFNLDATMVSAVSSSGQGTVFTINKATFPAPGSVALLSTRTNSNDNNRNCFAVAGQPTFHGIGFAFAPGLGQWSGLNRAIMYGADTSDNINSLNVLTGVTTHLIAGSVLVAAGFTGAGDVNEFSIARQADTNFAWTGGSNGPQGNAFLVGYATTGSTPWSSTGTLTHVLNSLTNTIDGSPFAGGSDLITDKLHNSRIQPEGRYIAIATLGGVLFIWDTTTGFVAKAGSRQTSGHRTWIYGNQLINQDGTLPQGPNPAPLYDLWSALTPNSSVTQLLNPMDPFWISQSYISFNGNFDSHPAGQFSSAAFPLQPNVNLSDQDGPTTPQTPLGNEIYAVHADGSQKVDRMLWSRRTQNWPGATNCNAVGAFECVTGIQVSNDGQWVLFPSNWEQHNCIGTHPTTTGCDLGVDISGYPLIQVFLAKLPLMGGLGTPSRSGKTVKPGRRI